MLTILSSTIEVDAQTQKRYDCNGAYIDVYITILESSRTLTLTKTGTNPFQVEISKEGISYYVNDILCTEELIIVHGFETDINSNTFYDGYFVVLDFLGNQLGDQYIEHGELEEVKEVYFFDQTYAIYVVQTFDNGYYEYLSSFIELYNQDLELIKTIELPYEVHNQMEENDLLLLSYNYDNVFDIGVTSSGEVIYPNKVLDIQYTYFGTMEIQFVNEAILNGESVYNGLTIDYPGTYKLEYNDDVFDFQVHPIITGITNDGVYNEPQLIYYSDGNAILNDELYVSGTSIEKPGKYTFIVRGINDYSTVIDFTITASVEGVVNGHSYTDDLIVEFNGEGYLNNNYVSSPLAISDVGDYILKIRGENGYLETYEFSLIETQKSSSLSGIVNNLDIFLVVVVVVTGVIIIKKK